MAEDGDKGRNLSGLIALLLLAASAIVVKQLPYSSSRPQSSETAAMSNGSPQDVVARLWQDPFAAVDQHVREQARDEQAGIAAPGHQARHTEADIEASMPTVDGGVVILPVFTFGTPYADDAENRRRERYAVLAALSAWNYIAVDNRRIGYVRLTSGPVRYVPYEWLKPAGPSARPQPYVLVLWLDEDGRWDAPLSDLAALLKALGLCQAMLQDRLPFQPVSLKIIGPQTASVTRGILEELTSWALALSRPTESCFEQAEFYTLSTAVDLSKLDTEGVNGATPLTARGLRALRTIRKDQDLLPPLEQELQWRGVDPVRHRILLIGESDTTYGRELRRQAYERLCRPSNCPHTYAYLRGLDGFVPTTLPKSEPPPASAAPRLPAMTGRSADTPRRERADGSSQLDYLRRLSGYIRQIERASDPYRPVKAVGVLGSDVYDKLLIMQALRDGYPSAVFFTTDLDARFLEPGEFKWARNLVVVSSFGFRLSEQWQGAIPPFRDSYQTAQFLAVQLAMDEWPPRKVTGKWAIDPWPAPWDLRQKELDAAMTVRTFEIGRTAAMDLSPIDSDLQPRPVRGVEIGNTMLDGPHAILGGIALTLGALLVTIASLRVRAALRALGQTVRARRWATGMLVLVAVGLVVTVTRALRGALAHEGASIEPFAWFEGVSLWPSEIVRALAVLTAVALVIHVMLTLRRTSTTLEREFFEKIAGEKASAPPGEWTPPGALQCLLGIFTRQSESSIDTERLWRTYRRLTTRRWRFARIVVLSVLFDLLAVTVIRGIFSKPYVPYRGELSSTVDSVMLVLSVASVSVLMFSVTDAIWICLRFTRELGRAVPTGWPMEILARRGRVLGLPAEPLKAWLDMRFVAAWTSALMQIVYYPAVVICLLMVARSTVFDRWEPAPLGLLIMVVVSFGFTVGCAVSLRRMAERVRANTRETLTRELLLCQGRPPRLPGTTGHPRYPRGTPAQLDRLMTEVDRMSAGAFAPLPQQPFVRVALLPLSSAGGLAVIEWLVLGV